MSVVSIGAIGAHTIARFIHNSLHCCSMGSCPWPFCSDFCLSDHFLLQINGAGSSSRGMVRANARFPPRWQDAGRWREGFASMSRAMVALSGETAWWTSQSSEEFGKGRAEITTKMQVSLDALCWMQCCVGNIVREVWVHPRSDKPVNSTRRARSQLESVIRHNASYFPNLPLRRICAPIWCRHNFLGM